MPSKQRLGTKTGAELHLLGGARVEGRCIKYDSTNSHTVTDTQTYTLTLHAMAQDLRFTPSFSRLACIREKGAGLQAAGGTAPPPPLDDAESAGTGTGVGLVFRLTPLQRSLQ